MLITGIDSLLHEDCPGTIRETVMTKCMHASLTAIGRQLHDGYLPILAKPLTRELEDLVSQLAALEFGKRGRIDRAIP
jgi:hypothetical protein